MLYVSTPPPPTPNTHTLLTYTSLFGRTLKAVLFKINNLKKIKKERRWLVKTLTSLKTQRQTQEQQRLHGSADQVVRYWLRSPWGQHQKREFFADFNDTQRTRIILRRRPTSSVPSLGLLLAQLLHHFTAFYCTDLPSSAFSGDSRFSTLR